MTMPLALTADNVETVLDELRPYLISDGGNVELVEIDGPIVRLRLQGACGSCPSSTMTLKMGIERRLKFLEKNRSIVPIFALCLSFGAMLPTSLTSLAQTPVSDPEPDFSPLRQVLEKYGFKLRIELPPVKGNYGMLDTRSQSIWINPVVFDLGIARPTLIHEAVHAAQFCAGGGKLRLLELDISPLPFASPYFLQYPSPRREIEAEAYAVQSQPDGLERVISLLEQYCRPVKALPMGN
jgi:Fe-S cluster biogenesis protein NfuA